ncbi:Trm112 family protein [Spectribacter hydrogenooxidans]|uniref:Trm112 family protein n=1 Tax=Spectribacter hydrogenoxidans TaxID=3075608 RepID=A0ABU3BWV8_9GAMM|nr:Trm112 family protein [Salinisphaera sp. W335]MDT0633779.1 Trm112 family protein [Salinisphaera sp. W335]
MDRHLLDVLVCPVTGAAVQRLDADERDRINARIRTGEARYVDGTVVDEALDEALITDDRHTIYRIDDGIPVMLPDRGIACE